MNENKKEYLGMLLTGFNPPAYLEPGSSGPALKPLLLFLQKWGRENVDSGFTLDADAEVPEYMGTAVEVMKAYQKAHVLSTDGGCGPATRKHMLETHGFNLVGAMCSLRVDRPTAFFQPSSETAAVLFWGPGIDVTHDFQVALRAIDALRQES